MKKKVEKAGQKFESEGMILTVDSFSRGGKTGYKSLKECISENPKGRILVKNQEFGGFTQLTRSFLIDENG
jgi:hypothetical protein